MVRHVAVNDLVRIKNRKHKLYDHSGWVSRMDRGNVWVKIGTEEICTRAASLDVLKRFSARS